MLRATVTVSGLLSAATATGAGNAITGIADYKTYQAWGTTTASDGSATVLIQGSNNGGTTWDTIGTITLTLSTTASSDSFTSSDRYKQVRANVSAISGTGASVNANVGW